MVMTDFLDYKWEDAVRTQMINVSFLCSIHTLYIQC